MSLFQTLNYDESIYLRNFLIDNVQWGDGIKTRYGNFTRYQSHLVSCCDVVQHEVIKALEKGLSQVCLSFDTIEVEGIYLNYYRDGKDYCPNHKHNDSKQMILSLGAVRKLNIRINEKMEHFQLQSGSVLFFGDQEHGMTSQQSINESRISVVLFFQ